MEFSRLALSIKEGGSISYAVAYQVVRGLLKGLADKNNKRFLEVGKISI